ncbi:oxidoreductase [Solimonas sp. SE-A11]|uniref:oxidoreductase n=1 Tax=Solimonas sp. SE-A11 TaxID=3054954 RepID=UPI00259C682F|nr:oxidoreductase [Solimonas sp. SE-A11]MDM4771067.1 oxidoreductase [Solimonas sp. SE-A11]
MSTNPAWFITGASRGIGLELARAALAAGRRVAATSRRAVDVTAALGPHDSLLALDLDVTQPAQITAAVAAAQARFGAIDVLVNNAGYGHLSLFEESSDADARAQFDTNVFGLFDVTRAVLPGMRARRSGHIINVSSVGGIIGAVSASLYCASKFAVEGFSLSLADEVKALGIHVSIVGPGYIRTDFLDPRSVRYADSTIPDYAELSTQLRSFYEQRSHQQPGDPVHLAQAMLKLAAMENPPLRFSAGSDSLEMVEARLAQVHAEMDTHRELSRSVDGQWD